MADVIFNHREGPHSPLSTLEHLSEWQYVATRLMAHMGAYTPDNLDRLHWRWHHGAALRIREALIRHNIWTIRTPRPQGPPTPDSTTGHQCQRSPTTQGPPRQTAHTSGSQSPQRRPSDVAPPCSPQQSPLRPFTHPQPDHGDQRAPDGENGQHSPRTPPTPQGSRKLTGTQRQSRTPPSAARRVTFRADANNAQDKLGGRQCRQMSAEAEPGRRTKRPRRIERKSPQILPPTERARLAALNVHDGTAETAVSSPSTAASPARRSGTTPRPHLPLRAPHRATPISTPSVHSSHNRSTTTALQRRPECPHGQPHTPGYGARGTRGCEAGATAVNVATAPSAVAAQVPLGDRNTAGAELATRTAMQARSAG